MEEIIGDDLEMKNVAMKKLKHEFGVKRKETEISEEISRLKSKMVRLEVEKSEIKEIVTATKFEIEEMVTATETKLISAQKKDRKDIKDLVIRMKSSEVEEVKAAVSALEEICKCSNCKSYFQHCQDGKEVKFWRKGMNVRVVGGVHICNDTSGTQISILQRTCGKLNLDSIEWGNVLSLQGVRICKCRDASSFKNVVYQCK